MTEFSLGKTVDGPCDMTLACIVDRYDLAVRFVAGRAGDLEGEPINAPLGRSILRMRDGSYRRWIIEPIIAEVIPATLAHGDAPIDMMPDLRRHLAWEMPARNARSDPEGSEGD